MRRRMSGLRPLRRVQRAGKEGRPSALDAEASAGVGRDQIFRELMAITVLPATVQS